MSTRRLVVVLLACVTMLVALPRPAHACSCVGFGPAEMLSTHDAGFIGTLVARSGGAFGMNATWTFEVTQEIKGDFAPTVDVASPASGAACGFELAVGEEAAIFVRAEDGRLSGGLCSTLDADAMRAHLNPQRVVDTEATLLVAAEGGSRHLWLFDDRGRLANASEDARGEWLQDVSVCPGGTFMIELWQGKVVVRDLRTLDASRTQKVPRRIGRIWCDDPRGRNALAATRNNRTGGWDAIVRLAAPERPLLTGNWIGVEIAGDDLVAAVGGDQTQLRRISLSTGRETLLHTARSRPGVQVHVGASIEGFDISPDDERVAFEVTTYPENGDPSSEAFVYDIRDGRRIASRHIAAEGDAVRWLDDESLLFTSYEEAPEVLDAAHLTTRATLPSDAQWASATSGEGMLLGMDGPRLASVAVDSGEIRTLSTVPVQYSSWMIRLPRPLKVSADPRLRRPERPAEVTGGDEAAQVHRGVPARSLLEVLAIGGGLALVLTIGLVLVVRRRRRA